MSWLLKVFSTFTSLAVLKLIKRTYLGFNWRRTDRKKNTKEHKSKTK